MDKLKVVLLLMGITFMGLWGVHAGAAPSEPDFDYPQQVSADALKDLKSAQKSGDGQLAVDALVRFAIARSSITEESIDTIIPQIEAVKLKEKRADYNAMLNYLEALVFKGYAGSRRYADHSNSLEESNPADYTEWSQEQFQLKIDELINLALSNPEALKNCPITNYSRIIKVPDKLGATYCPNLLTFLSLKSRGLTNDPALKKRCWDLQVESCQGDIPAEIFNRTARQQNDSDDDTKLLDLYETYKTNEHSGLILEEMGAYNSNYEYFKDYLQRHPKGLYITDVKENIAKIEEKYAYVNYSNRLHSSDSIKVSGRVSNVNDLEVVLYRIPDEVYKKAKKDEKWDYAIETLERVDSKMLYFDGTVPFDEYIKSAFGPQPYGRYLLVGNYDVDGKRSGLKFVRDNTHTLVSDLTSFTVGKHDKGEKTNDNRIVVVDINSGAPQQGVTVDIPKANLNSVTDKDGVYVLPDNRVFDSSLSYTISRGKDKYAPSSYFYPFSIDNNRGGHRAEVYTDLAIYRPGETVQYAVVLYYNNAESRSVLTDKQLTVSFRDANYKEIEKQTVTTDEFGRAEGSFKIPTDRLNGVFAIHVDENGRRLASAGVNVSEYKAPTFMVTLDEMNHVYTKDQPVLIKGKVETYSGLPVGGNEVKLRLTRNEWSWDWRWFKAHRNGLEMIDTVLTTDAEGRFSIELPASRFEENKYSGYDFYSRYSYNVNAICTNVAGESQEANWYFIVGGRRSIEFAGGYDEIACNNVKPVKLPLIFNTTDENEKSVMCHYRVIDKDSKEVLSGDFESDNLTIDFTKLPSGRYEVKVHILGEEDRYESRAYKYVLLYTLKDAQPPVEGKPMWLPADSRQVDKNNVARIPIGVSVDQAYIYYIAYTRDKVIGQGWLNYKRGFHELALPIPKEPEEYVCVDIVSHLKGKKYEESFTMYSNVKKAMKVKVEAFRDKLVPGEKETWQFRLHDVDGKPLKGAMLLEMMDKAIDDIEHNGWSFNVPRYFMSRAKLNAQFYVSSSSNSYTHRQRVDGDNVSYDLPEMNLYDEGFFGRYFGYDNMVEAYGAAPAMMKMQSRNMVMGEPMEDALTSRMVNATAELAEEEATPAPDPAVDEATLDKVALREGDVKVALWRPMLTSGADGVIKVEFEAPQFNTTWIMQAIAYTADLYTGSATRNLVTQKPIMVKSSVPRFLRQGDKASLAATLQNATDEIQDVDAVIELFDPRTNEVLARRTFKQKLEPKGMNPLMIDWAVPDTASFVGFRVKAANKMFGDGEQVMVPVLQNISPVIEAKPFYVDAATPRFSQTLPDFPHGARVTLEYCDNPVWYCATALPTIYSDNSDIATSLAHSFYAVNLAAGITAENPQIREAVAYWNEHNAEDSTLVSMLERNSDLKIGTLLASPWIPLADRQTLRMSQLSEFLDPAYCARENDRIIKRLEELQMSDGGWPWFRYPGCESSYYTTLTVLELIGEVQHLGYGKGDDRANAMVSRALSYLDRESLNLLNKQLKLRKNDYSGFSDYVYVRSLFPGAAIGKENSNMIKKCLNAMKKEWKGTSMGSKAFYAVTFHRNGETKLAKDIIESIRQFAMVKPELGMYWDNLQNSWYSDKVATTSSILQAMGEIDPRQAELDQIRKWMLLMKQSNDWGSSSLAADAVYSLLSTGSKWLDRNDTPQITIGGEPLQVDHLDAYLGYFRREIPASSGAELVINRNGSSPAWGAVYSQYRAPMTAVEQVSIDEISIRKELHVYALDGSLKPAGSSFAVGDKVQVRVIIKNNKDLDFVTVKDERGSCFEPKDKTSGSRSGDGTYYYLETKDSETNIFFTSLLKGTHVVSYDAYITAAGEYSVGIATVQCQYAPQITAHSAGSLVTVAPAK